MKKIYYIAIGALLAVAGSTAYAINVTVPQSTVKGNIPVGNANGTYNNGFLVAGTNVTISTSTTGQISISATGGASLTGSTGQSAYFSGTNTAVGTSTIFITPSGQVGFGTTTPTANAFVTIQATTTRPMPFYVASTTGEQLFEIDGGTGFIGIGSTTPWAQLSVNPTSILGSRPEFAIGSSSATHFVVTGGGNVGIANTSPAYNLDVAGTIGNTETLGAEIVVDGGFAIPTQYTAATAGVNTTNETITLSSDPGWVAGDTVQYFNGGGTTLTGLTSGASYFIKTNVAGVISVTTTSGGAAVNLTATGNNAQFFIKTNWVSGTATGTIGGTAGWDLSGGTASHQVAGSPSLIPSVALVPTVGTTYKVQYTVSNWTVAGMTVTFGGVAFQAGNTQPSANGTYIGYVTAATTGTLIFAPVTGMRADIDNVSIKPVTSGITAPTGTSLVFNKTLSDAVSNEAAYIFNYTTNKASGNATGMVINQTSVSSPGTNNVLDVQALGVSLFKVNTGGAGTFAAGLTLGSTLTGSSANFTGAVNQTQTLTTTPTNGFTLNAAAALVGTTVRISPSIVWTGAAWNTTPTAASNNNAIEAYLLPTSGAVTSGTLVFANRTVNNNADATILTSLTTGGNFGIGTSTPAQKLDINGGMKLDTSTAEPTCDATVRGTFWFVRSGAGVKDKAEVCAKDSGDAYAWRVIY